LDRKIGDAGDAGDEENNIELSCHQWAWNSFFLYDSTAYSLVV
jgi:hypothetical protein